MCWLKQRPVSKDRPCQGYLQAFTHTLSSTMLLTFWVQNAAPVYLTLQASWPGHTSLFLLTSPLSSLHLCTWHCDSLIKLPFSFFPSRHTLDLPLVPQDVSVLTPTTAGRASHILPAWSPLSLPYRSFSRPYSIGTAFLTLCLAISLPSSNFPMDHIYPPVDETGSEKSIIWHA